MTFDKRFFDKKYLSESLVLGQILSIFGTILGIKID